MILLDTEVLLWVDQDDQRLGPGARERITTALDQNQLGVSMISFWEIAWLIKRGRIEMQPRISRWRNRLLEAGLQEIPVNGLIGIEGTDEQQGEYLSTARLAINEVTATLQSRRDRFITTPPRLLVSLIVATAMRLQATFVTADPIVLNWPGAVRRLNAQD